MLIPDPPATLKPKEWIEHVTVVHTLESRHRAERFLYTAYGGALIATFVIFFLQGFHVVGFNLPDSFLRWLGAATVGEIGGLAAMVYGALFRKK